MSVEWYKILCFAELGLLLGGSFVGAWLYGDLKIRFKFLDCRTMEAESRVRRLEGYLVMTGIAVRVEERDVLHEEKFIGLHGWSYRIPEPEKKDNVDG